MLIPNVSQVENRLSRLAEILDAEEVLLFERSTFLVIAHSKTEDTRSAFSLDSSKV